MKFMIQKVSYNSSVMIYSNVSFMKRTLRSYIRNKYLFIMFIPVILYYLIFHYGPMYGLLLAFKQYNFADGVFGSPWVGLEHFKTMFNGQSFMRVFMNTIIISSYKLVFGFSAPILFAILINEIANKTFKKFAQTLSYLPYFLSWVVLGGIIIQFLSPSIGPIGYIMNYFGLKPINFLANSHWFRFSLVVTSVWKNMGWNSIIYLAALAGINPELYEAAIVDGAGRLRRAIHITLPSLLPVITVMFIMNVGSLIYDDFDQVFNLYNVAVYEVGDVIGTYVYRVGFVNMEYGYATAVGFFKNFIALVLVLSTNLIVKKTNEYSLW